MRSLDEYLAAPVAEGHVEEPGFFNQLRALRYVGSKIRLMGKLRPILKGMNAGFLVDVFGGSGAVTMGAGFSKRVFNDLDADVVNFFRVLADPVKAQDLYRRLRRLPMSRQIFDELTREYVAAGKSLEAMDLVVRAASFFYRSSFAFGGKIRNGGFAASMQEANSVKEIGRYRAVLRRMAELKEFWQGTVIENADFGEIIKGYGRRKDALLFCDPPYFGTERYYSRKFPIEDHARLAEMLAAVPCGAVVTYYATPEIVELYPEPLWEHHLIVATKNSMKATTHQKQKVHELILVKRPIVARAGNGQMTLNL